jgi:exonuclease VII large subunit
LVAKIATPRRVWINHALVLDSDILRWILFINDVEIVGIPLKSKAGQHSIQVKSAEKTTELNFDIVDKEYSGAGVATEPSSILTMPPGTASCFGSALPNAICGTDNKVKSTLNQRLNAIIKTRLHEQQERLAHLSQTLNIVSPLATLQRGYTFQVPVLRQSRAQY